MHGKNRHDAFSSRIYIAQLVFPWYFYLIFSAELDLSNLCPSLYKSIHSSQPPLVFISSTLVNRCQLVSLGSARHLPPTHIHVAPSRRPSFSLPRPRLRPRRIVYSNFIPNEPPSILSTPDPTRLGACSQPHRLNVPAPFVYSISFP
jgi:hypothetical protein